MWILGISAFYHDSAACLIRDGEIIAAAQEERFSRVKHDERFPASAIQYCVSEAGINADDIDSVVFYEKPFVKFERLLETYLAFAPKGFRSFAQAIPVWVKDKLFQKRNLVDALTNCLGSAVDWDERLLFSEHHLSHAASAFFPSPFEEAAVLTMDGVGEWSTTSVAVGQGASLSVVKEIHFPHSLGLLYSAFTYFCGFKVNSGEYKLMGLAPYGEPKYADVIRNELLRGMGDGSFQLNLEYFDFATGLRMTSKKFDRLFGGPPRAPESELTQREMDLAASIQEVTEQFVLELARNVRQETGMANLCLAGGVALNCVANGVLLREGIFDNIWIQPAAGDAGGALGAALAGWHLHHNQPRKQISGTDAMRGAYLGPEYGNDVVEGELRTFGAVYDRMTEDDLLDRVVSSLESGEAVGWMQGRMEFGPRALGARSIIADPRSPDMQRKLNLKVKFRESFRPFAPSILRQHLSEWFEVDVDSPYMLLVANVLEERRTEEQERGGGLWGIDKLNVPRSEIPAVTHLDYSARIQTVHHETNPLYSRLLEEFMARTGCPVLVNTSFNVRGEPIVNSPGDAVKCFMGTDLDLLVIGHFVLEKKKQPVGLLRHYTYEYELD